MCRFLAYSGPEIPIAKLVIDPTHSLLDQSQNATEAKFATNGDGFGLAWYGADPRPGRFRDVNPAWSDSNLPDLCRVVQTRLFMAHVRAATSGATIRANCHPFTHDKMSFMHNGQLGGYSKIRRILEAELSDDLYYHRLGSVDSELLFLLLLQNGLATDPVLAIQSTLTQIQLSQQKCANDVGPTRISAAFSCGTALYAFRWASDNTPPSLYLKHSELDGTIFASEPLDKQDEDWQLLAKNILVSVSNGAVSCRPI